MVSRASPAIADADREFVITRVVAAPPDRVFAAWTMSEHLAQWAAPHGFTITAGETDLRPGGKWWCCMRSPDGTEHRAGGVYREIVGPERLVFTHAWEGGEEPGPATLVTVTLSEEAGGTRLTLHQAGFASAGSRDGHRDGWGECLERLPDYLRTSPHTIERSM